ncbi:Gfo/Idh/MocA family protein [Devosia submarina]|uniref:Gfo/Idh/MocA family protein n=1 Tax=Devosia submarina TaxID=1173082 RepID=UPI000D3575CC|nr:Gfo/Idh/MocA family oxidoreductase [Devosia submarina]
MSGASASPQGAQALPRIGFLGTGRIGLNRMRALVDQGLVEAAVVSDPSAEMVRAAQEIAPDALVASSFDELLSHDLDGVVIATPSALHAEQSIKALERGLPVFCQKPLGRTRDEVVAVVDAARKADRTLGVDLSYRYTAGMEQVASVVRSGTLGQVFAADLVFHNAYGPDKPWFFDKTLSGGGCVMDLGVHMVDLALWVLHFPEVTSVTSQLFSKGQPLAANSDTVEDFAVATLTLATGAVVRVTTSWHLHAGRDAVISADFYGTEGGASFSNVGGSFLDFEARHNTGTQSRVLSQPPDDWSGRAPAAWAASVAQGGRFDPAAEQFTAVADILDRIYAR